MFEVGDKVKLLRAAVARLVIGNIYTVSEVFNGESFHVQEPEGMYDDGRKALLSRFFWEKVEPEEPPAPRTMKDVKVGDKVRRIRDEHMGMEVGDVDVVNEVPPRGGNIGLRKYGGFHDRNNLELVIEPEAEPVVQPQPEVVMPYQFKVGDVGKTRDGRLYRVAATDIVTETNRCVLALVKKDEGANEVVIRTHIDGKMYVDEDSGGDLLPPKITLYQVAASGRVHALAAGEVGDEGVYIAAFGTQKDADIRAKELKQYYKEVIQSTIERDQK